MMNRWTRAETETARRMRKEGFSFAEIACRLDRTAGAVEHHLKRARRRDMRIAQTANGRPEQQDDLNYWTTCRKGDELFQAALHAAGVPKTVMTKPGTERPLLIRSETFLPTKSMLA